MTSIKSNEKNIYNNGKIYKIYNDTDNKIYIGNTCKSLD